MRPNDRERFEQLLNEVAEVFHELTPLRASRVEAYYQVLQHTPLSAFRQGALDLMGEEDRPFKFPGPGEFKAKARGYLAAMAEPGHSPEELEGKRATLAEVDEVFAEFEQKHGKTVFGAELLSYREWYKRRKPGDLYTPASQAPMPDEQQATQERKRELLQAARERGILD